VTLDEEIRCGWLGAEVQAATPAARQFTARINHAIRRADSVPLPRQRQIMADSQVSIYFRIQQSCALRKFCL